MNPKYAMKNTGLFEGGNFRHTKPIFMMAVDRSGGGQCRWKLHYTGCAKQDKSGECLKLRNQLKVPEQQTQRAVSGTKI